MYTHPSQRNTDYCYCHGFLLSNVGDIKFVRWFYDVHCQHCVHFKQRVDKNQFLSYDFQGKETLYGIGEFHVNGHVPQCFPRHSPQFMPGAAIMDGERLESLWSDLNDVFVSCQGSTLTNRTQTLDRHFNYSNWKKSTGIGM